MANDEMDFFAEDDSVKPGSRRTQSPWKIMIVDDDPAIHEVTTLALENIEYEQRPVQFLHAYSGQQCIEQLAGHNDVALVLLDVVMEADDAGLVAVERIRHELKNRFVRIILRTGQPGQAPERKVITDYDINDYKEKTELTSQKLFTSVITALRSYHDIMKLERNRKGLEKIIEASANIFRHRSMEKLISGVLMQIMSIIGIDEDAFYGHASGFISHEPSDPNVPKDENRTTLNDMVVISGTGRFEDAINSPLPKIVDAQMLEMIEAARKNRSSIFNGDGFIAYLRHDSVIYIDGYKELDELERRLIEIFCSNVSVAFENVELNEEILDTQKEIIFTLGSTTEFRSKETGNHIARVAELARRLALLSGVPDDEAELIKLASPLHDVGKIAIPDSILLKPGKLTEEEYEVMKTHTTIGYDMLKSSRRPIFQAASTIAYEHQEKWDGSGYPRGLKGSEIHLYGRIIAIADVFDALANSRCYKEAWGQEEIRTFLLEQRGKHFDPVLVDLFLENYEQFVEVLESLKD